MRRGGPFFLFLLLLPLLSGCGREEIPGGVPPGPLGVARRLEPARVVLGKPALLTVLLRRDPGVEGPFPPAPVVPAKKGRVKVLEKGRRSFRLPGGGQVEERTYQVFPFEVGRVSFPPLRVRGRRGGKEITASAGPLTLTVDSALRGKDLRVEEPREGLDVPSPFPWPWLAWAGGGLFLALLLAWWILKKKGGGEALQPPPLPPHLEALRALARIRKLPRNSPEQIERVVVEASAAVRRYIEKRFGLRAPERTTEEFLAEAGSSGRFGPEEKALLESFLFECDRAKFAGWTPPPEKQEALLDAATAFVERTAPSAAGGRE